MHFPVLECPRFIRKAADQFKDLAGKYYPEFVAMLSSSILGIGSLSDTHRFLFFSRSVSQLSRFFELPQVAAKLSRRHRKRLLNLLPDILSHPSNYLWAFDDTIVAHWGKKTWGVYSWWDNTDRCFRFGHKLLVIGVVDRRRKTFIPVIWEILHKDYEAPEVNPLYQKATEVALRLMGELKDLGFPKLIVAADSWYAGKIMYEGLTKLGFDYVLEVRMDKRKLVKVGRWWIKNISAKEYFNNQPRHRINHSGKPKYACEAVVTFKGLQTAHKAAAFATHKRIDQEIFAIYVTNRLTWNASDIWRVGRDRWAIEVQFRDLKGLFTLGEPSVRSEQAIRTAVCIAMIALTVIRLEQLSQLNETGTNKSKPKSAGYIVRDLQLHAMQRGLSKLVHSNAAQRQFRQRLTRESLNRKPAEVRKIQLSQNLPTICGFAS